jgi:hypothetical protein
MTTGIVRVRRGTKFERGVLDVRAEGLQALHPSRSTCGTWELADDRSWVAAVVQDDVVIATMSATVESRADAVREYLCGNEPPSCVRYPVCVLRRAATREAFRRHGLNSLLRIRFYEAALLGALSCVMGSVLTAQQDHFISLGYRVFPEARGWSRPGVPTSTIVLDMVASGASSHVARVLAPSTTEASKRWPLLEPIDLRETCT